MTLAELLERVIHYAARDEAELVRAREEWAELAGRVFDDDPLYEERTAAFLEWFALERLSPDGKVPAARFLAEESLSEADRPWAEALCTTHRSLFEVERIEEAVISLSDLLGGGAFVVTERRRLAGVEPTEIFEARLYPDPTVPSDLLFTRSFQFYPREARKELKDKAERARKAGRPRAETLFQLMRLRLKAMRYQHVAADKIYRDE
jgi:hypothetical protein